MSHLVCFGLLTLDHQLEVESVPEPNQKIVASRESLTFGGPAANAAATASTLGSRTRLVTAVGDGPLTSFAKEKLSEVGVEVVDLRAGERGAPPISTVLITQSTGDRAVISRNARGVQSELGSADALLEGAEVLLLDGHHMRIAQQLAKRARELDVLVLFDGGSWKEGTEALLPHVDLAVVSKDFVIPPQQNPPLDETGSVDALQYLIGAGCSVAAKTQGEGPIVGLFGTEPFTIQVDDSVEVADTLGAGDVLHGALAHFRTQVGRRELTADRVTLALEKASEIATFSCQFPGAHGWFESQRGPRAHRCGPDCDLH